MKQIPVKEIIDCLGNQVLRVIGDTEGKYIDNIADVAHVNETTLDWVNPSKKNKQVLAEKSNAIVLLVDEKVSAIAGKVLIYVNNPKRALAIVGNAFFVERPKPEIHPTAIVDQEAIIGESVHIGPYCVIGKAKIGNNCIIESFVRIYDNVEMGEGCHIYDNAVIGTPGFGMERDEDGNLFRFPQIGKVILGKYVDIGCQTCVDRGALSNTIIGDYSKIDSQCKIAHNNVIGKNVAITGSNSIAGSNNIEDDVWIGPNCSLKEWGHIEKGAFLGIGSVVIRNVREGDHVFGNPAENFF